ncbi:MAG: SMP-30/gluconolactonase/LRE family protein [Gammaproteobacteria bacterium]
MKKIALLAVTAACFAGPLPAPAADAGAGCVPYRNVDFLCGPDSVEDLVGVPGTRWVVGSGFARPGKPGHLHLIDTAARKWRAVFPDAAARVAHDTKAYGQCPGAPDAQLFSAHGLALRAGQGGHHTLMAVNHGGREAVEFFELDATAEVPALTWVGCLPMPKGVDLNSIAALPDGGLLLTRFRGEHESIDDILAGKANGAVYTWRPGGAVTEIPGSAVAGANGIEVSADGRRMFVAAWAGRELVRFDRGSQLAGRKSVKLDFMPDNLRWAPDGSLLVAGQNAMVKGAEAGHVQPKGWAVVRVDPETLEVTPLLRDDGTSPLQGVASALQVGDRIWLGSFQSDRIGHTPAKTGSE